MENFNFEKLEKRLKEIDLPDFELSQRKEVLRQALLNSPYFKKEKKFVFSFPAILFPVGVLSLIFLFVFFGYPYAQNFYLEAQAEALLDRTEGAIKNLGPDKEIYALSSGKKEPAMGSVKELQETTVVPGRATTTKEIPPGAADQQAYKDLKKKLEGGEIVLEKIDLQVGQLKEEAKNGEIKFLQYVGEEKSDDTILKKIRYTNQEGNLITEFKIDGQTNLPVTIQSWRLEETIKNAEMIREIKSPEEKAVQQEEGIKTIMIIDRVSSNPAEEK